jgi:peptidoglycan L-alanyl-D-glutamate endopeptidase CwlK
VPYSWGRSSRARRKGLHPDLIRVLDLFIARAPIDCTILEGLRNLERQRELLASGATRTMRSRHLTGHAVDVAPLRSGKPSWHWPDYHTIAPVMKAAAEEIGVPIEWGGDWETFKDGPHWQLPWETYP